MGGVCGSTRIRVRSNGFGQSHWYRRHRPGVGQRESRRRAAPSGCNTGTSRHPIPSHSSTTQFPHNHPPHPIKQARAYGGLAWVLNPCRVSYEAFDVREKAGGGTQWSAVAYATAGRHLIAGAWMDGRVGCV